MIEIHPEIPAEGGTINSFVVHPEEGGPHPLVLFYMDAPGKREELHDMARRIASVGYCVILPNLYWRRTRDWHVTERTEPLMKIMFEHMESLTNDRVVRDTQALLDYAATLPAADTTRVGAVGYCMSGPFVMHVAAAYPAQVRAIAAIHGAKMVTDQPDSPHRLPPRIRCESYFACAERDIWAPPAAMATLEAALRDGGTPYRLEWYPGTEHGFVFPKRAVYQREGAERHWERLFSLFRRTLQAA